MLEPGMVSRTVTMPASDTKTPAYRDATHPFRGGKRYTLLYGDLWASPALGRLTPAIRVVVIAFVQKWGHVTMDGQHPKPMGFSYSDVRHLGISRSTFVRTMREGEGMFWTKVEVGGGRRKSHYVPCDAWKVTLKAMGRAKEAAATCVKEQQAPVSMSNRHLCQPDTGLGLRNGSLNEVIVVNPGNDLRSGIDRTPQTPQSRPSSGEPDIGALLTAEQAAAEIIEAVEPELAVAHNIEFDVLVREISKHTTPANALAVAKPLVEESPEPGEFYLRFYRAIGCRETRP